MPKLVTFGIALKRNHKKNWLFGGGRRAPEEDSLPDLARTPRCFAPEAQVDPETVPNQESAFTCQYLQPI